MASKKRHRHLHGPTRGTGRTRAQDRPEPLVGELQKHSFRLWWREHSQSVLLLPLVSWAAPANVSEGGLLVPSLQYCDRRWSWWPRQVVADMGYLAAESKRWCRERWRVAVVTHLRSDMKLVAPFVGEREATCEQGQPLEWSCYLIYWFRTYCWLYNDIYYG